MSLASWECVEDGEGVGVKWVPDHAATHCQGCAAAFSLIVRKHHCRYNNSSPFVCMHAHCISISISRCFTKLVVERVDV